MNKENLRESQLKNFLMSYSIIKAISDRIYLLTIYDKSEKEGISDKELKQLMKFI